MVNNTPTIFVVHNALKLIYTGMLGSFAIILKLHILSKFTLPLIIFKYSYLIVVKSMKKSHQ